MKIGLIYLPHPYLKQPGAQAPLGLMYLASVLRVDNDVKIYNFASMNNQESIEQLDEMDVYGISITSLELLQANRFAYLIKEKFPKAKVILGGPGTISDGFIDWNIIDSVCRGDGEITILEMVQDIKENKLFKTYIGKQVEDINTIPFPSRDLLNNQGGNIFAYDEKRIQGQSTQILTSRGCPFNCSFCAASYLTQKKMRFRTAENVIKEVKQVIDDYGIRQFRFADETFVLNRVRLKDICKQLKKLNVIWRISTRVDTFTEETAKILMDSGCVEISFGCESFDNSVLKLLNKHTTAEMNAKALEISCKAGLKTRCMLMIRTPGQTKDTIRLNIDWLKRVPYDILCCTTFVPIPGCDVWYHPEKYGVTILDKNLDHYNFYFFGGSGEVDIKNIIRLNGRDDNEVNEESQEFRNWLKTTNKVNEG